MISCRLSRLFSDFSDRPPSFGLNHSRPNYSVRHRVLVLLVSRRSLLLARWDLGKILNHQIKCFTSYVSFIFSIMAYRYNTHCVPSFNSCTYFVNCFFISFTPSDLMNSLSLCCLLSFTSMIILKLKYKTDLILLYIYTF